MMEQIEYIASWINIKLSNKLGQRGAEMIEYAIVLACIAAIGVHFYTREGGIGVTANKGGLNQNMFSIWLKFAKLIQGL